MRKILTITLVAGFLLFNTGAQAGVLTSATWVGDFQGTPFTLTTGGGGVTASGTSTATGAWVILTVNAPTLTTLDTTGRAPVFMSQTLSGGQTIAISGGAAIANQGIAGQTNIYIGLDASGILLFSVPLNAGVAGNFSTTALVPGFLNPIEVTATFFAWTSGMITVGGGGLFSTTMGTPATVTIIPLPDLVTTGSFSLTAGGGGSISLVSPTIVRVCLGSDFSGFPCDGGLEGFQASSRTASVTTLKLNFVPEPGGILLIGAGVAGLLTVTRRQRSERSPN